MNNISRTASCLILTIQGLTLLAQSPTTIDTIPIRILQEVVVNAGVRDSVTYLTDVIGTEIFAGKKTNKLKPDATGANLAQNNIRQAFAKIAGLTHWDMDGAGTQLNIGTRGTDSHRSIEMNMRQNGYITNSDIFGYPENHYTVPLQGVREVQLLRGAASLQYGSQFGGMLNLVMKEGDSTRPVAIESEQTRGSNNFFNSFSAMGGTIGKINYYAYYDDRRGNGWRPNSAFAYHAYYANVNYRFSRKGSIALQFSRMDYLQQIAGGLTDAQFRQNAQQSTRSRNFFSPEINIPALLFRYLFSERTELKITTNGLFGQRNSVQFINAPDVQDTINAQLGTLNNRQVDRDYYSSWSTELRMLHRYKLGNMQSVISGGLRYSNELTKRRQKGQGTSGADFDLYAAKYGIDLRFRTYNYAAFAENIFYINKRLSITPGVRYEIINSQLSGVINNASAAVNYQGSRSFPLFGAGLQYKTGTNTEIYANISQAYRPYLYSFITPADRVDLIDPNLQDSRGHDIDLGYRGAYKNLLRFDINFFYLFYGNRVGLLSKLDAANHPYLFTTNVGDAVSKGVEAYAELSLSKLINNHNIYTDFLVFNSVSYTHARYTRGMIANRGDNVSVVGNHLENTPEIINKTGFEYRLGNFSTNLQYSYTGSNFNDALNTVFSANGITGKIPAYHLWDWSASILFKKYYRFGAGINNFSNEKYFNRRITFYPGPGILPADGRTFYVSLSVKL